MITERGPTPAEMAKRAKSERWNCVAAALFAITYATIGALAIIRGGKGVLPYTGYAFAIMGVCWAFLFWRSLRRYKAMVSVS